MKFDRWDKTLGTAVLALGLLLLWVRAGRDAATSTDTPPIAVADTAPVPTPEDVSVPPLTTLPRMAPEEGEERDGDVAHASRPETETRAPVEDATKDPKKAVEGATSANVTAAPRARTTADGESTPTETTTADAPDDATGNSSDAVVASAEMLNGDVLMAVGRDLARSNVRMPAVIVSGFTEATARRVLAAHGGWLVVFVPTDSSAIKEIAGGFNPEMLRDLPRDAPAQRRIVPVTVVGTTLKSWIEPRWAGPSALVGWLMPAALSTQLNGLVKMVTTAAGVSVADVTHVLGHWEGDTPHFVPTELRLRSGEVRPVRVHPGGVT